MPVIPNQVIIRDAPQWIFKVDGQDFPWRISKRGPVVYKYPSIWAIDVQILSLADFTMELRNSVSWPVLQGRSFPWAITEEGFEVRCRQKEIGILNLAFYAENVDTDTEVMEVRVSCGSGETSL